MKTFGIYIYSGRFASNEYIQTLAVIHPKEKSNASGISNNSGSSSSSSSTPPAPAHSTHTANDIPMARIVEPQPGHAQLSPHHAELNEEYATTQLRDGLHGAAAGSSHAVTIVAACCIGFLLLMVVVGAARVRGIDICIGLGDLWLRLSGGREGEGRV